jgi:hypothetical protein
VIYARRFALVLLAVAMTACATLSFDQRLAGAYATNTSIRSTAAAALDGGRISSESAENVLALTDQARAVLDDAADGDERGELVDAIERAKAEGR